MTVPNTNIEINEATKYNILETKTIHLFIKLFLSLHMKTLVAKMLKC